MTNEELAKEYNNKYSKYSKKSILSTLFKQCYTIILKKAYGFYGANYEHCKSCGVEVADLVSDGYFAMLEAINAYNGKETEYKFITFLNYPLKNHFNKLAGYRTASARAEPLNNCNSLDAPISEDSDTEFIDTIADKNATTNADVDDFLALSEVFPICKEILKGDKLYYVIEQRFKHNKSQKQISENIGCKPSYIHQLEHIAFRQLRNDASKSKSALAELKTAIIGSSYKKSGFRTFRETGTSSVEWAVIKMSEKGLQL